jgi:hypothetical protein
VQIRGQPSRGAALHDQVAGLLQAVVGDEILQDAIHDVAAAKVDQRTADVHRRHHSARVCMVTIQQGGRHDNKSMASVGEFALSGSSAASDHPNRPPEQLTACSIAVPHKHFGPVPEVRVDRGVRAEHPGDPTVCPVRSRLWPRAGRTQRRFAPSQAIFFVDTPSAKQRQTATSSVTIAAPRSSSDVRLNIDAPAALEVPNESVDAIAGAL